MCRWPFVYIGSLFADIARGDTPDNQGIPIILLTLPPIDHIRHVASLVSSADIRIRFEDVGCFVLLAIVWRGRTNSYK